MSETTTAKRVHSFQASASAFGGRLYRPIDQNLPSLANTCLPSVGGYNSARHPNFQFHEIISIDEAYTHVGGSFDPHTGNWTTIASSVIKGFNVGHTLFADRIVAQISIEHPADGVHPTVSFLGTHFDGLRIGSCELKPTLQLDMCAHPPAEGRFPNHPYTRNANLLKTAQDQSQKFMQFWLGDKPATGKFLAGKKTVAQEGENTKDAIEDRGSVLCSIVKDIGGKCGDQAYGHAIHVPHFGFVYLGELTVGCGSFDLTMIRLDLGSPLAGNAAAAQASASGGTGKKPGSPSGPGTT
jgi:hypothetical protein